MKITAEEVISNLNLVPLPHEGGFFRRTWKTESGNVIYYLVTPESWSGMHLLDIAEMWHFYAGDPLKQLQLFPDGSAAETVFSSRLELGHEPQLLCPAGVWQSTKLADNGEWALVGTSMAPPYTDECIRFPEEGELVELYPQHEELIKEFL